MYTPKSLDEYVGQELVKTQVRTAIEASKKLGKPFPHALLTGPRGTGKTTLARLIAKELGLNLVITTPSALKSNEDLYRVFANNLQADVGTVFFIDEVHRLGEKVEEDLYLPMENRLFVRNSFGKTSYSMGPFTLLAATTLPGRLTEPLIDRFGLHLHMDKYGEEHIKTLLWGVAINDGIDMTPGAVDEIAARGRNNPRVSKRLLERCHDLAVIHGDGKVTVNIARKAFEYMSLDETGLEDIDRRYLLYLYEQARPVGVASLEVVLDLDKQTIQSQIEPYLIERGLIVLTGKGRALTTDGIEYIKQDSPNGMTAL